MSEKQPKSEKKKMTGKKKAKQGAKNKRNT
jgi:hypothetical protein